MLLALTALITGATFTILLTVTDTTAAVPVLPAASLAIALIVCVALVRAVVFQVYTYGAAVIGVPATVPSMTNWTLVTPTLSEADAVRLTVEPETVAPAVGAVIETVGGVVSGATGVVKVKSVEVASILLAAILFTSK